MRCRPEMMRLYAVNRPCVDKEKVLDRAGGGGNLRRCNLHTAAGEKP